MSDHNAKRQARQTVAAKAEGEDEEEAGVEKELTITDKVDLLAKSLDESPAVEVVEEAPEVVVETPEVVVETPEVVVEAPAVAVEVAPVIEDPPVVEDTAEKAKKTEDEEEEKKGCGMKKTATELAVEKLTAFLMDSVVPMMKGFQTSINSLQADVIKTQSLTKSFSETSNTEIQKSYDGLKANVEEMSKTIELIAKSAQPRRSIANTYVSLEKSFGKDEANMDVEVQIHKAIDAGMSYAEARTAVMKSLAK